MQAKTSVLLPASNPVSAQLYVQLGASTLNLPTDLELAQSAAIRAAVEEPPDMYVEAPANLGGFVRMHEVVKSCESQPRSTSNSACAAARTSNPYGRHLRDASLSMSRERVRRARIAYELLQRTGSG
jgi:hypothetical protein